MPGEISKSFEGRADKQEPVPKWAQGKPYILTECKFSLGQLQVLVSTLQAELKNIGYDPDEPCADGAILESILFEVRRGLSDCLAERDDVK